MSDVVAFLSGSSNGLRLSLVRVLLKMMFARCAHVGCSDNGAARRFERSTCFCVLRHWVKGEALVRNRNVTIYQETDFPEEADLLTQLKALPELLEEILSATGKELGLQERLRERHHPALVRAAFILLDGREKAKSQLLHGEQLWVTPVALQQSTSWAVAQYKAKRFPGGINILDICSGIGVDAAALLARGPVTSVDIDPAMSLRCLWNNQIWSSETNPSGFQHEVQTTDAAQIDVSGRIIHADPDRRVGRDRPTTRLEQYCPNLDWMHKAIRSAAGGAIKLGPASNFMQKFPGCEIELISLNGECREATVWFGELAGENDFRATLLPSGETISVPSLSAYCPLSEEVQQYIFDPDPAIVRSGMLEAVGEMHNLQRLDKADEYLTAGSIPETSFVTAFQVDAVLGNNPRELNRYLRTEPSRDYEIKCRHLSVDAAAVHKKLPRGDGPPRVLLFIRLNGKAKIVVARRIQNA